MIIDLFVLSKKNSKNKKKQYNIYIHNNYINIRQVEMQSYMLKLCFSTADSILVSEVLKVS